MCTMNEVEATTPRSAPPLVPGERLDQRAFHERYEAMPAGLKAELIGGVVHMPSPLSYQHGRLDSIAADWLSSYEVATPGVYHAINTTTILGDDSEPQPDHQLRIDASKGGRSRIEDRYVVGPPELLLEVAQTSRTIDLGGKKADYERWGVLEYVFVGTDRDEVMWFALRAGKYHEKKADADGIFRSEVFPGLWLDPAALLRQDRRALRAVLGEGTATAEHAAFVNRLAGH